jgi:hypothetical protein
MRPVDVDDGHMRINVREEARYVRRTADANGAHGSRRDIRQPGALLGFLHRSEENAFTPLTRA